MLKVPSRLTLIGIGFSLAALAVVARAAQLQLARGGDYRARAASQQTAPVSLPARRGTIFDRNGVALAQSQETFAIGVAPRDLDDPARAASLIARATGRQREAVRAALRSGRVWLEWPGPYSWNDVAPLRDVRGVRLTRRLQRFYPRPSLAPRLLGRVDVRGRGGSGLERAFDSVLAGRAGSAVMLRDAQGRMYPAPSRPAADPIDGADVVLTLDAELQEITERALAAAVAEAKASGGDAVILQPRTGEILALSTIRGGGGAGGMVGVIGDPYEPGSTAKIFMAAALLREGKASPRDTVFTENGVWTNGRNTIRDTHKSGWLTMAGVIQVSSNIGIVKLSQRLTPAEQFAALRDFGFGSPTGVEFPGESPGRLRRPSQWSGTSAAALAMGYEMAVTPLQLAAAYAAIANEGVLLEPTLVREVRDPSGEVRWRRTTRPVRRVVPREVARLLSAMLRDAVEEGTGRRAQLGSYQISGKTGTTRRVVGGRYAEGRYTASFAGLFPSVDPQLVLLVKIDDPEGDYFGGSRAAPVTRTILEAALATPAVALDRGRLSRRAAPLAPEPPALVSAPPAGGTASLAWPLRDSGTGGAAVARSVPDVTGQSLRAAARALHRSGFQVRIRGWGTVTGTTPAAGEAAGAGSTVVVRAEQPGAR